MNITVFPKIAKPVPVAPTYASGFDFYGHVNSSLPLSERIEASYIPEPNTGCWIWTATTKGKKNNQRPSIMIKGKARNAAHVAFELAGKQKPPGTILCHRCDNSLCINPDHLYAGTHQDNTNDLIRSGNTWWTRPGARDVMLARVATLANARRARTTCIKGHPLAGDNLYVNPATGKRVCVTCRKRHVKAYQKRVRARS